MTLSFDLPPKPEPPPIVQEVAAPAPQISFDWRWIFEGDSDSIVAWCVGAAEGTRGPDGHKNPAYYGHTDPGNKVWNLGTFSWQHGAASPEEADAKQIARLKIQAEEQEAQAQSYGLRLTLKQRLNGLGLATQSPTSGQSYRTSRGYIALLTDATLLGKAEDDAILWAMVNSYKFPAGHPRAGQWNAPGLGNTLFGVHRDQLRRKTACEKAIEFYTNIGPHRDYMTSADMPQAEQPQPEPEAEPEVVVVEPVDNLGALSFDFP